MANENNGINLVVANPEGKPVVYTGSPATTLTFSLTNLTGANITFGNGTDANTFEIFLPVCFALSDLDNMHILLEGWAFSVNSQDTSLMLVYSGGGASVWNDGAVFSFDVTGVQTTAQPNTDTAQVTFINFSDGVPSQVTAPLSVSNPPVPGNADLTKVLQVSLDNQGGVIVSPSGDPLQNTVFLNIKNIGGAPLYSGDAMWQGNPTVTIVFVYGTSTGSLAPDNKTNVGPGSGSAWNIVATIPYNPPQNIWGTTNPSSGSSDAHPRWFLKPSALNQGIIGTGDNANITFSFSEIISFTPPGHTQMIVQFSGFMKDENTPYDDAVFVLDMVKQNAPATRGLINFFSPTPLYTVNQPNTPIAIPLRWAMFDVASVTVIASFPGISPIDVPYPNPTTIAYDNAVVTIPGTTQSTAVTITLQAYNGTGGFLNSMQFTVYIQANMFVDPRDGKVYPVVKANNRLWMSANLDYVAPAGSSVYGPEAQYGRLYQFNAAAQPQNMSGWRLPNKDDWENLISTFTYAQLISGGDSGFDALLNGSMDVNGVPSNFSVYGYYWTGVNNGGKVDYLSFSSKSNSVTYLEGAYALPAASSLSVRYVKDVS